MNVQDLIVNSIRHSVVEIFSTMLASEIQPGEVVVEPASPEANDGVVSFIGIAGTWTGTGSITCSPPLACRICSQMLLSEAPAVNEDVLDAVAELTNMIIGNVKSDLEGHLGPLGLSIPTVIFGRNFRTSSAGNADWIVERFCWEGEELLVKMCLAPTEKTGQNIPHATTHSCPMDI